jgi:sucrose-6-phosphate hydrolase SacC (GH32 family)
MKYTLFLTFIFVLVSCGKEATTDKTLVAWIEINDPERWVGTVFAVQNDKQYDGIMVTGKDELKWRASSEDDVRSGNINDLSSLPTVQIGKMEQVAVVYAGDEIRLYINGQLSSSHVANNIDLLNNETNVALFSERDWSDLYFVAATIEDARIYNSALTAEELNALKPDEPSIQEPYAWWDFEGDVIVDRTGTFVFNNTGSPYVVKLVDGKLVIYNEGGVVAARKYEIETPEWPDNPPDNWLTYHLAHPGPGDGSPGDPNPAFYYKGRYHLTYIYAHQWGYAYAHVSSADMVHWQWHPTVLTPPLTGHGMFSGTGFFTDDGTPAMIYHGEGSDRNFISYALDDNLDEWSKPEPVEARNDDGTLTEGIGYWDPDLWRNGDTYYALSGGKNPKLMKSTNLNDWKYMGELLHEDYPADIGVAREEDISCANMFKIGDKWMLLCISHYLGARYYLGDFKDEKYLPESHHLMNFQKNNWENVIYFAPESIIAADGRRVMWAWIINGGTPSAVQGLPRELELPDDGILRIKPLKELETLRYDELTMSDITVSSGTEYTLEGINGDAVELVITFTDPLSEEFGVTMLADENGEDGLTISTGANKKTFSIGTIEPPFELENGEDLSLRIFIDKNLVEVFANNRQAAVFTHEHIRKNPNISLFTKDADVHISMITAWKMKSIYN